MYLLKPVTAVARRFAAGDNFNRLSPTERQAAWPAAFLTHVLLLPVTFAFVAVAPALRPGPRVYLVSHFLIALLFAKLADVTAALCQIVLREKPRFERSGWLFAFGVTLLPLCGSSFLSWLLA